MLIVNNLSGFWARRAGASSVFDPSSLFASGEEGAWIAPRLLSSMFQDRAGTTQVTADGQTVGKILDQSGRGNHFTAPNDAARPLYKTDGTYHWLLGDGVNNYLKSSTFASNMSGQLTHTIGVRLISRGANRYLYDGATVDSMDLYQSDASGNLALYAGGSGSGTAGALSAGTSYVVTAFFDSGASASKIRINQTSTNVTCGSVNTGAITLFAAANGTGSTISNMRLYESIFRDAGSTTQEINDTEAWVNTYTGAY